MTVEDQGSAGIRVSDAERDATVTALRGHFETGRLSFDEFSDRVDEAYAARTDTDLTRALRELPTQQPLPVRDRARTPRRRRRGRLARQRGALSRFTFVNGICIGVWAASGAGYFWPIWVLIPTGFVFLSRVIAGGHHDEHDGGSAGVDAGPPTQRDASEATSRRVVMSVLFVDIVNSTGHAASLGDTAWHAILADYERRVDEALKDLRGEKLFTKGDEVVAGFILPASAIDCGLRIRDVAHQLGLDVRAGVHAGEVDRIGDTANGIAMHIGRRVCEAAGPGQLLVSSTVRDLLAGSSFAFTSAGDHELKGLTGSWRLYQPERQ